jgi:hypothetical protein
VPRQHLPVADKHCGTRVLKLKIGFDNFLTTFVGGHQTDTYAEMMRSDTPGAFSFTGFIDRKKA